MVPKLGVHNMLSEPYDGEMPRPSESCVLIPCLLLDLASASLRRQQMPLPFVSYLPSFPLAVTCT